MKIRLITFWHNLQGSFLFLPGLLTVAAIVLSFVTISLDQRLQADMLARLGFAWSGGAEGARSLLSTVAGSMVTLAGVVFSITIVAFALASTQLGPRLLTNFMRDTGNQIVLGTFIATFVYCLLVLRTIRDVDEAIFVPRLSVTVAVLLSIASLGVLIYFIDHVARSIQAPYVIAKVANELLEAIDRLFPRGIGHEPDKTEEECAADIPEAFEEQSRPVDARKSGYLQAIDDGRLLHLAREHNLVLSVTHRPGFFVTYEHTLVRAWPGERISERLADQIRESFILGPQRTSTQEVEFALDELVEVAVRATSPAINDPFTAIHCIDWLGAALSRLTEKKFPSRYRYDRHGSLRMIIEHPYTFKGITDSAFSQIRQFAGLSAAVRIRLLETIAKVMAQTDNQDYQEALMRQAEMIRNTERDLIPEQQDREDLEERFEEVKEIEREHSARQ